MRGIYAGLILSGLVGCSPSLSLEHVSTLTHETMGVQLHDDGQVTTGIGGMVCTVQATGSADEIGVMDDVDFTDAPEFVEDLMGSTVLASSIEGLHLIEDGQAGNSIALLGVLHGRLYSDGVVALRAVDGTCRVDWTGSDATDVDADLLSSVTLDMERCADGVQMTVDPASGTVYLADGRLHQVSQQGLQTLDMAADVVSFDAGTGVLFVGDADGTVSALQDGTTLWQRSIRERILSVDAYDGSGAVVVGAVQDNGRGVIRIFGDASDDSMPDMEEVIPEGGVVVASDGGDVIGVILQNETHFFEPCSAACNSDPFSARGDAPVRFID